jgi:hypothetical protein
LFAVGTATTGRPPHTTDGRTVILSRYTETEPDQALLLQMLKLSLPGQPPPRIMSDGTPISQ